MYIADMLSHAYLHDQAPISNGDYQIFQLKQDTQLYKEIEEIDPAKHVRLSEDGLATIRKATLQDDTLTELTKVIYQGWPDLKQNIFTATQHSLSSSYIKAGSYICMYIGGRNVH